MINVVIYDITHDSVFTPRLISALGYILIDLLAIFMTFYLKDKAEDKTDKRFRIGARVVLSIFLLAGLFNALNEYSDYFDNYFVNQYNDDHYEIVSGNVLIKDTSDYLKFSVDKTDFICKNKNFNSRGYHVEDFNSNPFKNGDYLKIYYVIQDEELYGGYEDNVIVRIEKFTE